MTASRTFRIFVSSTFSDLKAERNALADGLKDADGNVLAEAVFPRLRELCLRHGCRFQAIDLRWGVSGEAKRDQQAMNICLEELRRCQRTTPRPNFIVLLGQRYGACPLPPQMPTAEFEAIHPEVVDAEERALLEFWYRRDDNAVPPEHDLHARSLSVVADASDEEKEAAEEAERLAWEKTETKLRATILAAIKRLGWPAEDLRRVKYEASATHQEILEGALSAQLQHPGAHVFGFFRTIKGFPEDETAAGFVDFAAPGRTDPTAAERVRSLKERLRGCVPNNVHEYSATWTGRGPSVDHLRALCDDVYRRLSEVILEEIDRLERADPVDEEAESHKQFGEDRAAVFFGRAVLLERIRQYVGSGERWPLVIHGASGIGKSTLMAKAADEAAQLGTGKPKPEIIRRFIGATPNSSHLRSLLEGLCQELGQRYPAEREPLARDVRELSHEFARRLGSATPDRSLVIFLDSIDQLSRADGAHGLWWLPHELPTDVKLIVSAVEMEGPRGEAWRAARGRLPADCAVALGPLSAQNGEKALDEWLRQAGRTLQPAQRAELHEKFAAHGLPLYLKLAFEETRRWKSHEAPPRDTKRRDSLSVDIPGILNDLLRRLEQEQQHGKVFTQRALGYLAASRRGLTEDELLDALSNDQEVLTDFVRRSPTERDKAEADRLQRLPVVIWSRLRADLDPYLIERRAGDATVLAFYHRQVREAVEARYLNGRDSRREERAGGSDMAKELRLRLADYFVAQPVSARTCDELPWLLRRSGAPDRLRACLLDIERFIEIETRDADELMRCWVWLREERVMGKDYLAAFETWRRQPERDDDSRFSYVISHLAYFLNAASLYADAEPLMRQLLVMEEEARGPDHPDVATALIVLALLLKVTDRREEAEGMMRRALQIVTRNFGEDHPNVATALDNLAQLLQGGDSSDEAEEMMRRALGIDRASFGQEHFKVAIRLSNLAQLLQAGNRLNEAEAMMRLALEIDRTSFGPDHPKVAIRLNNLAQLLLAGGDLQNEAEKMMRRALAIDELSFGPGHPTVALRLNNLAQFLHASRRLEEAEPLMRRALEIEEENFGVDHANVATGLLNLTQLLQASGRLAEAETCVRRALTIDERTFGPTDTRVAADLNQLAHLLLAANRLTEAEPLMRRALAIDEQNFPTDHANVVTDHRNLAWLLRATHRPEEAEVRMREVLKWDQQRFGREHPEVAADLSFLAELLQAGNHPEEAAPMMCEALKIAIEYQKQTGYEEPEQERRLENYRQMLGELGWKEEEVFLQICRLSGAEGE